MAKKLLASLFIVLAVSFVFANLGYSQTPKTKQYRQRGMNQGVDDGMLKRAPGVGDEQMVRRAPENIDDRIFKPRGSFRSHQRTTRPKAR